MIKLKKTDVVTYGDHSTKFECVVLDPERGVAGGNKADAYVRIAYRTFGSDQPFKEAHGAKSPAGQWHPHPDADRVWADFAMYELAGENRYPYREQGE